MNQEKIEMKLLDLVKKYYLIQHVMDTTRCRGRNEPSMLDLVFSDTDCLRNLEIVAPIARSDHGCVVFDISVGKRRVENQVGKYVYKKKILG